MDYKRRYKEIVNYIQKKSFPEIKKPVKIISYPPIVKSLESTSFNFFGPKIFINLNCRKRSKKELTGQFAHEFCHLVLDHKNKNTLQSLAHFIRKFFGTIFNDSFSRNIEERTERETIKRGYAHELFMHHQDWRKKFGDKKLEKTFWTRGYFRPEKIESYAKKIRKW